MLGCPGRKYSEYFYFIEISTFSREKNILGLSDCELCDIRFARAVIAT